MQVLLNETIDFFGKEKYIVFNNSSMFRISISSLFSQGLRKLHI